MQRLPKLPFTLVSAYLVIAGAHLHAATYNVTSNSDATAAGTLRTAMQSSLSSADATDNIVFDSGLGTITLTTFMSSFSNAMTSAKTINFNVGGPAVVIDGASTYQAFSALLYLAGSVTVNMENVTVQNCKVTGGTGGSGAGGCGGGGMGAGAGFLIDQGATVNLTSVTFAGCNATGGTGGSATGTFIGGGGGGGACGGAGGSLGATAARGGGGGGGFRSTGGASNHGGGGGGGAALYAAPGVTTATGGAGGASAGGGGGGGGGTAASTAANGAAGSGATSGNGGSGLTGTAGSGSSTTGTAGTAGSGGAGAGGGAASATGTSTGGAGGNGGPSGAGGGGGGGANDTSGSGGNGGNGNDGSSLPRTVGGGGGGGGRTLSANAPGTGGIGGDYAGGGGGGGGGGALGPGGAGGFGGGGGGGGSSSLGGIGGFGSGGGGSRDGTTNSGGAGGTEGGAGGSASTGGGGGGGAGLGGAVFVRSGGTLTILSGCVFSGSSTNTVTAGTAGSNAGTVAGTPANGNAKGGDAYLHGGALTVTGNVTFNASLAMPSGTAFTKSGVGALTLTTASSMDSTTTISAGTVSISADNQLGTGTGSAGAITIASSSAAGTLKVTGSSAVSTTRNITLAKDATSCTIDVTNTEATTGFAVSGIIADGSGTTATALTKTSSGILTLSGANTYVGATTISAGTLALSVAGVISSSASTAITGTLDITQVTTGATVNVISGAGTIAVGSKALTLTSGSDSTFAGVIQDTGLAAGTGGTVTKNGSAKLTLSNANTYTGSTAISVGTLALSGSGAIASSSSVAVTSTFDITAITSSTSINTLSGSGTVAMGTKGLTITQNSGATFSGPITGSGALTKAGAATLTLSNANTSYTGAASITAGTLALSVAGSINNAASVNVDGTFDITAVTTSASVTSLTGSGIIAVGTKTLGLQEGTYSGVFTGSGTINKTTSNTLTLTGTSSGFTGTTNVNAGTVNLNGTLAGPVIVASGSTLSGNATTGSLTSSGVLSPGNSIGTMTVNGDLTLLSGNLLELEMNAAGSSSNFIVSGNTVLTGDVNLTLQPGIYFPGTLYTIITTSGTASGTFTSITSSDSTVIFSALYGTHLTQLLISDVISFVGLEFTTQIANAVVTNLEVINLADGLGSDTDLYNVIRTLSGQSTATIQHAAEKMAANQYSAYNEATAHIACELATLLHHKNACRQKDGVDLWLKPFGMTFHQKHTQEQVGFHTAVSGFVTGIDAPVSRAWHFGSALAFTRRNICWEEQRGQAELQCWHFGFFTDYNQGPYHLGLAALFGRDNIQSKRHIAFTSVNRNAFGQHYGIESIGQIQASANFTRYEMSLQPYVNLTYSNLYQRSFQETVTTADSLALFVYGQHGSTIISEMGCSIRGDVPTDRGCWSPEVYLAWVQEIPIFRPFQKSHFYGQDPFFAVEVWDRVQQFIEPGVRCSLVDDGGLSLSSGYSLQWGDHFFSQTGDISLQLVF